MNEEKSGEIASFIGRSSVFRHTQMSGYAMEDCENLTIVPEGYGKTRFVVKRELRCESSQNVRRRKLF